MFSSFWVGIYTSLNTVFQIWQSTRYEIKKKHSYVWFTEQTSRLDSCLDLIICWWFLLCRNQETQCLPWELAYPEAICGLTWRWSRWVTVAMEELPGHYYIAFQYLHCNSTRYTSDNDGLTLTMSFPPLSWHFRDFTLWMLGDARLVKLERIKLEIHLHWWIMQEIHFIFIRTWPHKYKMPSLLLRRSLWQCFPHIHSSTLFSNESLYCLSFHLTSYCSPVSHPDSESHFLEQLPPHEPFLLALLPTDTISKHLSFLRILINNKVQIRTNYETQVHSF